jgi:MFS family permease
VAFDRIGSRLLAGFGALVCAGAMVLLAWLPPTPVASAVALRLVLFGVGTGIFQSPNTSAAMATVPRPQLGVASAVLSEMRNVGMVLGIGLAGLVLHLLVSEEVLSKYVLNAEEAGVFVIGIDRAFLAGAAVAAVGALTALIKRPGTGRKA